MEKFFELHDEKIIGYKALTDADLGRRITSHQTHIGLFDDVLTFLPNEPIIEDSAMFIYESNTDILSLNFDRIANPDGTFRSPKIKVGGRGTVSLVSTIREIARNAAGDITWFLFWFGLQSGQAVFWLFNNQSQAYKDIVNIGLNLDNNSKGRVTVNDSIFCQILSYIESTLDVSTKNVIQELEIETQIPGKLITERKIRRYDIQRAQTIFTEIGKKGEVLVAEYFDKLKFENKIKTYSWVNENSESGNPYDFCYQDLADNVIYLDVKTTKFDFEQRIVYSDREIDFALTRPKGCYNIYRVYNLCENSADLRICKNCTSHFSSINENILDFQRKLMANESKVQSISIAFQPTINNLSFDNKISLIG